jgi:hypothetical protein
MSLGGKGLEVIDATNAVNDFTKSAITYGLFLINAVYVCQNGIIIPWTSAWYLKDAEKNLDKVRKLLDDLTDEQKERIGELRESSAVTLEMILHDYALYVVICGAVYYSIYI